jgi:hypothetical protein
MSKERPSALLVVAIVLAAGLALPGCFGGKGSKQSVDVEQQLGFDQATLTLRQSRAEARIRDCMKAQGFDYVPVDPVAERVRLFGTANPKDEQFGYYVTTLWGRIKPRADPNERYRAGLPSADQKAYDRALGGDNPGATFEDAFDTGDFSKLGGCRAKAISVVFGGRALLSEIQGKLDQLDERIIQDQRMVNANEKWRSCMAAAGYHYSEGDDIDVDLQRRLEAIVGPVQGKFATGPPPGQPAQPYDHAALAALQRDELATWKADTACEKKYLTPVEVKVRAQYEAQFRRQNLTLLNQAKPVR